MLQEYYPIMWEHIDTMRKFDEVHDRGSFGSVIYVTLNKPEKTIVAVKVRIDFRTNLNFNQKYF